MSAPVHDCVGALLVHDGRILLGRRSEDCDWLAGAWDVFGGHVEPGESGPQACTANCGKNSASCR